MTLHIGHCNDCADKASGVWHIATKDVTLLKNWETQHVGHSVTVKEEGKNGQL